MPETFEPADAHLQAKQRGREVIAAAVRERRASARWTTVATTLRWWIVLTALVLAGCRSGHGGDTYAKGTQVQEQCCEHLQGGARDKCLSEVTRVDDPAAAKTATNQQTFACVVEHFQCDAATGHATQPSAQEQYDCIADLQ